MKTSWHRRDIPDAAVVRAAAALHAKEPCTPATTPFFIDGILSEQYPGCPEKVIDSAIERCCDKGYFEYGVSMRTGWPTEKGLALLEAN